MPRQARIDSPGTLHHIIVRGIERSRIFKDENDRADFLDRLRKADFDLKLLAQEAATQFGLTPEQIIERGNDRVRVKARSLFCYWAVRKLGHSSTEIATMLRLTRPAVSISVKRGKHLADELNIILAEQ